MDTAKSNRTTGFSLVELVISLGIITVLAAIATPRYARSLARYRVERAAHRVTADLAAARTLARTSSAPRTVTFNTSQYQITAVVNPVNLADEPYRVQILSASLGGDSSVIFNAYGIPDSGGTILLQSGPIQKTITLDANTAEATIQ